MDNTVCCGSSLNLLKVNKRPSSPREHWGKIAFCVWCFVLTILGVLDITYRTNILHSIATVTWVILGLILISWYQGYFKSKSQRKRMKPNKECLQKTLLDMYNFIPSEVELKRIETKAKEYLQTTTEQINLKMYPHTELCLVGSVAERFSLPISPVWIQTNGMTKDCHGILSDFDFMISPTEEKVSFKADSEMYHASLARPFRLDDNGGIHYNDGFKAATFPYYNITNKTHVANASGVKNKLFDIAGSLDIDSFPHYLPETCWRRFLTFTLYRHINFVNANKEGPAIKYKIGSNPYKIDRFYADLTLSLKCLEWPEICDWGERENTQWPKFHEIEQLKRHGCHFVPKSQLMDTHTWRISFSKVEVKLSALFPTAARICFVSLKIIGRDYLFVVCEKLRSYHLKSILLYTLENNDPVIWNEENIEFCFKLLLGNLEKSFKSKSCPSFWVSCFDLYDEGHFEDTDFENLLKKLNEVQNNPSQFIEPFENEMAENLCESRRTFEGYEII